MKSLRQDYRRVRDFLVTARAPDDTKDALDRLWQELVRLKHDYPLLAQSGTSLEILDRLRTLPRRSIFLPAPKITMTVGETTWKVKRLNPYECVVDGRRMTLEEAARLMSKEGIRR